jgi:hypothetical protein
MCRPENPRKTSFLENAPDTAPAQLQQTNTINEQTNQGSEIERKTKIRRASEAMMMVEADAG